MESLIEMGFPVNAAKRAWYYSDGNVEAAMNWLCSHMDDADYNTGFFLLKIDSTLTCTSV